MMRKCSISQVAIGLIGICAASSIWLALSTTSRRANASESVSAPAATAQTYVVMHDLLVGAAWTALRSREPDPRHGAAIAAQGIGPAVPACAQCHAFNGGSDGSGAFPRIAGQSTFYLTKQLLAFASGARRNAVMSPIAKALTPDYAADVAAYYASASAPLLPLADVDPSLFKRGEQLATIGDETKTLQACTNCHGPGGIGESPAIPYLAGQYAHYTAFELHMWQRGFRKTSPDAMGDVAKKLDDSDIDAIAAYFQQVSAVPPNSPKPKE